MSTPVDVQVDRAVAPSGHRAGDAAPSRLRSSGRRSVPHLALGVLLVLGCAIGFVVVSTRLTDQVPVLALARPVTVGQALTPADLREVMVAADPEVAIIPSFQAGSVVGSTAAATLPAGTLLHPGVLGQGLQPGSGEAMMGLALAPGQFPPELAVGARVLVLPAADPAEELELDEAAPGWRATVAGVHPTTTDAITVVSIQLDEDDAAQVGTAGLVTLIMVPAGGD